MDKYRKTERYFVQASESERMRLDDSSDIRKQKQIARKRYKERKIDSFVKWSMNTKGYIRYKDLDKLIDYYDNNNQKKEK